MVFAIVNPKSQTPPNRYPPYLCRDAFNNTVEPETLAGALQLKKRHQQGSKRDGDDQYERGPPVWGLAANLSRWTYCIVLFAGVGLRE
ncbi:hypothetical protein CDAR_282441 [Caerostris darwini]|uniref:Uncharacterized protein n=1 Tax=Caerostris darwini TaxID=1538125 RepID=A0AAV4MQD9_9ARAC|nr:hypothetical protein CDAR_282441 [Caerostris darwini]